MRGRSVQPVHLVLCLLTVATRIGLSVGSVRVPYIWNHMWRIRAKCEIGALQVWGSKRVLNPWASSYLLPYGSNGAIWRSPTVFFITLNPDTLSLRTPGANDIYASLIWVTKQVGVGRFKAAEAVSAVLLVTSIAATCCCCRHH